MHFDYMTWFVRKFNAFILVIFALLIPFSGLQKQVHFDADHSADKTDYPFVLMHGFLSWGEDAKHNAYQGMPYWGMFNGDLLKGLREAGFTCVAPTVDAAGSNWDRVCEVYAKLTGTRVDYGKAHSEACGHARYGEDYTGKAMLEQWDSKHKINLIGHSQAGKDVVVLASLLEAGSEAERKATTDGSLSGLFTGGKGDWVHACVGASAVYNGTSLFSGKQAIRDTKNALQKQIDETKYLPRAVRTLAKNYWEVRAEMLTRVTSGDVADPDTAIYDMTPDNAVAMNKHLVTAKDVYYFSVVFEDVAYSKLDGHIMMDRTVADPIIGALTPVIGRTNTVTDGGLVLDEAWQINDGCVNTISQRAPFGAPTNDLSGPASPAVAKEAKKGVYNVLPTIHATHMWIIGDFVRPQMDGPTYLMHIMEMVNAIG